jgi:hypothetical protein
MILWGNESRITPRAERQELSQKNPKAQVENLDRTRLALNQERPKEFNRLVLNFLAQPVQTQPQAHAGTVGFIHANPEGTSEQPPTLQQGELDYYGVAEWNPQHSEKISPASDHLKGNAIGMPDQSTEISNQELA